VSDARPIGVVDSGSGGLTVARAILDSLPGESLLYVGDTARFPYGPRPLEEIRGYALEIAAYLVSQGSEPDESIALVRDARFVRAGVCFPFQQRAHEVVRPRCTLQTHVVGNRARSNPTAGGH